MSCIILSMFCFRASSNCSPVATFCFHLLASQPASPMSLWYVNQSCSFSLETMTTSWRSPAADVLVPVLKALTLSLYFSLTYSNHCSCLSQRSKLCHFSGLVGLTRTSSFPCLQTSFCFCILGKPGLRSAAVIGLYNSTKTTCAQQSECFVDKICSKLQLKLVRRIFTYRKLDLTSAKTV